MENREIQLKEEESIEKVNKPKGNFESIYGYKLNSSSRLDLMRKSVAVFATLEALRLGEVKIRKKLIDVLTFYVLNGYSRKTKIMITETLKISNDNLTQINAELTKSGYLIRDKNNFRKKSLHPDLERLKKIFINDNPVSSKRAILIRFDTE